MLFPAELSALELLEEPDSLEEPDLLEELVPPQAVMDTIKAAADRIAIMDFFILFLLCVWFNKIMEIAAQRQCV